MRARTPKRVPSGAQIKHLPHLLNKQEKRIAGIALITVILTGSLLGWQLMNRTRTDVPAVGGEYTEGLVGSPQLINPLYALTSDVDTDLTRLVFSGLMRYDSQDGLVPDLAQSYEINEDQTVYTFTLRDDAVWHDGRPVRASDVAFTISAIQNSEYRSPLQVSFAGIAVEQVDEHTIRFTLSEPFAPFLSLMTVGILPSHLWQNVFPTNAALTELNTKPIGSGPYKFDKFVKDSNGNVHSYTFVRNADYYDGAPFIEKLHFKFYPDTTSALEALRNNNVEGLSFVPLEAVEDFEQTNSLTLAFPSLSQYTAAFFNEDNNSALSDLEVREALWMATDKSTLVENVLGGYGQITESFILPGMVGHKEDIETPGFDVDGARSKLDEAGWTLEEGADVRSKDGATLDINVVTLNTPELTGTAQELANQWAQIGVRVSISSVDNLTFQNETLKNRSYDVLISGELYSIDPDPYAFWHSSQTQFPGLNLSGFSNRKADELIEQARGTSNLEDRADAYVQLQELILEEVPAIFLYQPAYTFATSSKIKGMSVGHIIIPADRFGDVNEWYIRTRKGVKRNGQEDATMDAEEVPSDTPEVPAESTEEAPEETSEEEENTEESTEESEDESVDTQEEA